LCSLLNALEVDVDIVVRPRVIAARSDPVWSGFEMMAAAAFGEMASFRVRQLAGRISLPREVAVVTNWATPAPPQMVIIAPQGSSEEH